jgi:hypothetical protein
MIPIKSQFCHLWHQLGALLYFALGMSPVPASSPTPPPPSLGLWHCGFGSLTVGAEVGLSVLFFQPHVLTVPLWTILESTGNVSPSLFCHKDLCGCGYCREVVEQVHQAATSAKALEFIASSLAGEHSASPNISAHPYPFTVLKCPP